MNKIIVEVSVGELLDKISILEIKQEKIKDSEKLKFIDEEHSILKNQLNNNIKSDQKLNEESKKEREQYIFPIDGNFLFEIYLMGSMKNQGLMCGEL